MELILFEGKNKCDFCNEEDDELYSLQPNEIEWDILAKDFKEFNDTPVILVCENCLQGYCGANPGMTPTKWFNEVYPKLIKQKEEKENDRTLET